MNASIENLRCFLAASQQLSFVAGARLVGLTAAAFGQRIRQLEVQVGEPLFTRTTRKVQLTDAGLRLQPTAAQIVQLSADALAVARGRSAPQVELTLGTRHELGMSFVQPALRALTKTIPELAAHLYFGSGEELLLRLRSQALDLAIGSMRIANPRLDCVQLHLEAYVLVGAPSLLRRRPLPNATHANEHTLLDLGPELPLFDYLRNAPRASAWRFGGFGYLGTIAAIRTAVLLGDGVAVLPHYLVARDLARGRLRAVVPARQLIADHFKLIFRRDDPRRPLYDRMAAALLRMPLR